jgi:hypothetical protein
VPIVASKDVFPPFALDLFQTRFKRLQINLVSKGEKKGKIIQDFKLSIFITSITYMLTLILEPTQAATVLSSYMDSTPNFSTHEHSKPVLDELKISKTHQAADKAKKVGCFCE